MLQEDKYKWWLLCFCTTHNGMYAILPINNINLLMKCFRYQQVSSTTQNWVDMIYIGQL